MPITSVSTIVAIGRREVPARGLEQYIANPFGHFFSRARRGALQFVFFFRRQLGADRLSSPLLGLEAAAFNREVSQSSAIKHLLDPERGVTSWLRVRLSCN